MNNLPPRELVSSRRIVLVGDNCETDVVGLEKGWNGPGLDQEVFCSKGRVSTRLHNLKSQGGTHVDVHAHGLIVSVKKWTNPALSMKSSKSSSSKTAKTSQKDGKLGIGIYSEKTSNLQGGPMYVESLISSLPKAEQHVHIVGSTRPETLLWLIEEGGLDKPYKTVEDIRRFFEYRNFPHFIDTYCTVVDWITKEDQFERITYELLQEDARCNVRYVEASFSASDHVRRGLDYGRMLNAINRGVSRAHLNFGIECNIRIDLVRNYGPQAGMQTLDWIEGKDDNIVSIDIGGSEERFPAKPFAPVYRRAKKMGLHLVAHAGEAGGVESIWEAVRDLKVERIGHGVAAISDPKLMNHLLERKITIEACPTSNVRIGVIPSLEKHPIRAFLNQGLNVTVNTDDPSMFDTDMNNEYLQLQRRLNFTIPELFKFSLNAVDSSFLPEEQRIKLHDSFLKEYERLLGENYED